MSSFFREMMPDNLAELSLLSGLSFISYKIINHYKEKGLSSKEATAKFQEILKEKEAAFKEKERELIERFQEKENNYKKNTLSQKALNAIKNL